MLVSAYCIDTLHRYQKGANTHVKVISTASCAVFRVQNEDFYLQRCQSVVFLLLLLIN